MADPSDGVHPPYLGLRLPEPRRPRGPEGAFDALVAVATTAERAGFDGLWLADGPGPEGGEHAGSHAHFEPYSLLGALAARTTTAALGIYPSRPASRPPSMVAKQLSAVDVLSHGRAVASFAAGPTAGPTVDPAGPARLAEELQIVRLLLTEPEATSFSGSYYRIEEAVNRPRPLRPGGLPLVVAADGDEVLDVAARFADGVLVGGGPERVAAVSRTLDERGAAAGRPAPAVPVLWSGSLALGATGSEAEAAWSRCLASGEVPQGADDAPVVGTATRVAEVLGAMAAAGARGAAVWVAGAHDPGTVAEVGALLRETFPGEAFPPP